MLSKDITEGGGSLCVLTSEPRPENPYDPWGFPPREIARATAYPDDSSVKTHDTGNSAGASQRDS
jgi:hypothetical protein